MQWGKVQTVMLDMDGTLLDLHFDNYFWFKWVPHHYAFLNDLNEDEALPILMKKFNSQRGLLNWYCLDYWSEQLSMDLLALKYEIQEKIAYRPNTKVFLEALKQSPMRAIIVTNAHQANLALKLSVTNLDSYVDHIYCSHDFNVPKESNDFWVQLAQKEPFDVEHTLLIDDSLDVLKSAKRYGIKHLLCISQPDTRKETKRIDEFESIVDFHEILPLMPV